jgi:hypothetical protein
MKKEDILKKIVDGELEVEEASELLAELERPKQHSLSCKVSENGAISVSLTLQVEQWDRLLGLADEIREFIKGHKGQLKQNDK